MQEEKEEEEEEERENKEEEEEEEHEEEDQDQAAIKFLGDLVWDSLKNAAGDRWGGCGNNIQTDRPQLSIKACPNT